jgi:hypothetical protein
MWGLLSNLGRGLPGTLNTLARTGGSRFVNSVDDLMRQQLAVAARRAGPAVRRQSNLPGIPGFMGDARIVAATPLVKGASLGAAGLTGTGAVQGGGLTGGIENTLNQAGPALDRFVSNIIPDNIEKSLSDFAKEQEKKGLGGALELATPLGFLASRLIPNPPAPQITFQQRQARQPGQPVIRNQEVSTARAEVQPETQAPPAPNLPSPVRNAPALNMATNPADRAYEAEKRNVAQQVEQDPLNKKYRIAELTKAYNTAKPEEKERIGLEIWATTNPELASKLKPGQLGYTEAVSAFQAQSPLGGFKTATGNMQFADKFGQSAQQTYPGINPFEAQTPLTGIDFKPPGQIGVTEAFQATAPIPGATQAFTDPLNFLKPNLSQTQQALIRQAFERGLK